MSEISLNLGSGKNPLKGYINVDKYGEPDVLFDLETFPWPWETNSVDKVVLNHVLEHLGETTKLYLNIIKELYRICKPNADILVVVPHPRHDNFISDPTHVRPITPEGLVLFSKKANQKWIGYANSPLAFNIDVDFEVVSTVFNLEEPWLSMFKDKKISQEELEENLKKYNNVAREIKIILKVIK